MQTSVTVSFMGENLWLLMDSSFLFLPCREETWPDGDAVYSSNGHPCGDPSVVADHGNVPRLAACQPDKGDGEFAGLLTYLYFVI